MFNRTEFVVQMQRAGYNQQSLADAMKLCVSTLNKRMKTGNFSRDEMALLIDILAIESADRFYEIFFAQNLRDTQE